ncbi:hypothetical protein LSTR_LSTR015868 [Laodelphax striatellus]|uniref:Cytochrome P450 n=1 Tax=Laodelphax striatellus TaxID=195883 RepID=A0A482WNE0_LAOST|nr:hypothetical protein LSTR_LSTR015868 [Laodelphax striatellus]
MRLHIPSGALMRNCKYDYKIPGTDKVVKRGETVVVMTSAMHHDEKYFQNPDKFDPERFSDMRAIQKGVYLPFGCGPRMCFGEQLLQWKI